VPVERVPVERVEVLRVVVFFAAAPRFAVVVLRVVVFFAAVPRFVAAVPRFAVEALRVPVARVPVARVPVERVPVVRVPVVRDEPERDEVERDEVLRVPDRIAIGCARGRSVVLSSLTGEAPWLIPAPGSCAAWQPCDHGTVAFARGSGRHPRAPRHAAAAGPSIGRTTGSRTRTHSGTTVRLVCGKRPIAAARRISRDPRHHRIGPGDARPPGGASESARRAGFLPSAPPEAPGHVPAALFPDRVRLA
jgi:hypothetical protein